MPDRYPFLISVPHGGIAVPDEVRDRIALSPSEMMYYCDPATRDLYDFRKEVSGFIDTRVSRMVVDLNRPPYHLAPKYPDGAIKSITGHNTPVYREGRFPDIDCIHQLMVNYFFPFHEQADRTIDEKEIKIAFDCHSMLPDGLPNQHDAGKKRPVICLSNNGDSLGNPRNGTLATCRAEWLHALGDLFRDEFVNEGDVMYNVPFEGGFIVVAHHWHRNVPWVQIEVNRALYEVLPGEPGVPGTIDSQRVASLRKRIWAVLTRFWEEVG